MPHRPDVPALLSACRSQLSARAGDPSERCATCLELARLALDEGDARAFAALVQLLAPGVVTLLRGRGASQEEAEDLVQTTLLRLLTLFPGRRSVARDFTTFLALRAYVLQCARSAQIDLRRRKRWERPDDDALARVEDPAPGPDAAEAAALEEARMRAIVTLLETHYTAPAEATLIELRFYQGRPPREIAALYPQLYPGGAAEVSRIVERIKTWLRRNLPPELWPAQDGPAAPPSAVTPRPGVGIPRRRR